uniref:Ig-like domain-containing protein n=1 Tax=Hippocampus comes TaxID=109280 RepID=A0A3Q2XUV1_HIPCM
FSQCDYKETKNLFSGELALFPNHELLRIFCFTTSSSQTAKLPEYWEVTYVDDVEILHFDSNSRKTKAKLDWVDNITAKDPEFWKRENENNIVNEQVSKVNIEIAKEHFNHTGVHLIQRMYGCEWDEETGEVDGWEHYSYDSEDFISFEPRTTRWIAAHPQASITKNKLDQVGLNEHKKYSLTEICPFFLKNHVINGTPSLQHALKCFYPATSALFWRKDDEELHEDVEMVQLLPNHDGTFQTTAHLRVEVTPDAEGEYECVFQLAGVKEAVVVKLDSRSILSNAHARVSRTSQGDIGGQRSRTDATSSSASGEGLGHVVVLLTLLCFP